MAATLTTTAPHFTRRHVPLDSHSATTSDRTRNPYAMRRTGDANLMTGSLHRKDHGSDPTVARFTRSTGPSDPSTRSPNIVPSTHATRLRRHATRNATSTARSGMPRKASCEAGKNRTAVGSTDRVTVATDAMAGAYARGMTKLNRSADISELDSGCGA